MLRRWARDLPPEHVHVLPLHRGGPREAIWQTFAGLIGVDPDAVRHRPVRSPTSRWAWSRPRPCAASTSTSASFERAFDRGVYIRTYLADERLVPRGGDRYWPEPDQVEECRRRGRQAVEFVRERGFDVRGDLDDLLVPDELEPRRSVTSVTDAEVADVAVRLVARMLEDVREPAREAGQGLGDRADGGRGGHEVVVADRPHACCGPRCSR